MKKVIFSAILLIQLSCFAETTLHYNCSAPMIEDQNTFTMTSSLSLKNFSPDSPTSWILKQDITGLFLQESAQNSPQELHFNVAGTAKKVMTDGKKLLKLALRNRLKGQFIQLNLNDSNKLSSSIEIENGTVYKSSCKVLSIETCSFGSDYFDILNNPRINTQELGVIKKRMKAFDETIPVRKVRVILDETQSFLMFYTFNYAVDGGSTFGQIEDDEGRIVAKIQNSMLYQCNVMTPLSL